MRASIRAGFQACGFLVALVASGALAGLVWERLWDAPAGVAFDGKWFLEPAGPDYSFSGTGWYVVVALVAGAVTALALGWSWSRHEVTSLCAIVVGSVLAGWVMFQVGHALGPPDPQLIAAGKPDLSSIPSDLTLAGMDGPARSWRFDSSAMWAFPVGAMITSIFVYLLTNGRRPAPTSATAALAVENAPAG